MQLLLFANTSINWGQLAENGLVVMVVTAVFVIIVKPMVSQMLKNNADSIKAILELTQTITTGDSSIRANTKEAEARVLNSFNSLIAPLTVIEQEQKNQREQLNRIEAKLNEK